MTRNVKEPRTRAERRKCPFTEPHPDERGRDEQPRGECAVCGRPCKRQVRGDELCTEHDKSDLQQKCEYERERREAEVGRFIHG